MQPAPAPAPRSLPLRLAPHPGEALDSWLEAYAAWLGVPTRALLTALALTAPSTAPTHYTTALRAEEAQRAATLCGLILQPHLL